MSCSSLLRAGTLIGCLWLGAFSASAESPRQLLLAEYEQHYAAGEWDAALNDAQELLDYAREHRNSARLQVTALSLMARAYLALENPIAAESHFNDALALAGKALGSSSRQLVQPLSGLGHLYAQSQRHEQAVEVLERALIVHRRNAGLFDLSQAELLQQLTDSYIELGAFDDARRHLDYLRGVADRAYGTNSPAVAPQLASIAEWYSEVGDPITARTMYLQSIALIQRAEGRNSPALAGPLRGLASTYVRELLLPRQEQARNVANHSFGSTALMQEPMQPRVLMNRSLNNDGEKALLRAVKLTEQSDVPQAERRAALLDLADWYQIDNEPERALKLYRRVAAIEVSKDADDAPGEHTDNFEFPVPLYYPPPPSSLRHLQRSAEDVRERYVLAEFTVTAEGDVSDIDVVEEDANNRQVSETLDALKAARYRPRIVDGTAVATTGMRHRQVFRTLK